MTASDELAAALGSYARRARLWVPQHEGDCAGEAIIMMILPRVLEAVDDAAGSIISLPFDEAIASIEADFLPAIRAAEGYLLLDACVPNATMRRHYVLTLYGGTRGKDSWDEIMCKRIGDTWRSRNPSLTWLDDKVEQVASAAALCDGCELHLPLYAHALSGDAAAQASVLEAGSACSSRGEAFVVKPRHGANSCHVALFPEPREATEADVAASIRAAMTSTDPTWDRECWQLSQVPRGVVLQPMYAIAVPKKADGGPKSRAAPLELKVQVLFGMLVGGTLNTHPQSLWVTRRGAIHLWDPADLQSRGHVRCHSLDRNYGQKMPDGVLECLQRALRQDWELIRSSSEQIARGAGLDEIRVDWLLGDEKWGARIGELTYMGAGSRLTPPISRRLARAYAAGHLNRLGLLVLIAPGDATERDDAAPALWGGSERAPPATAKTPPTSRRKVRADGRLRGVDCSS